MQLVDFANHIRGNCLDLVLTNMPERISEVKEMSRLGGSDHEMVFVRVDRGMRELARKRIRNWRRADLDSTRR